MKTNGKTAKNTATYKFKEFAARALRFAAGPPEKRANELKDLKKH